MRSVKTIFEELVVADEKNGHEGVAHAQRINASLSVHRQLVDDGQGEASVGMPARLKQAKQLRSCLLVIARVDARPHFQEMAVSPPDVRDAEVGIVHGAQRLEAVPPTRIMRIGRDGFLTEANGGMEGAAVSAHKPAKRIQRADRRRKSLGPLRRAEIGVDIRPILPARDATDQDVAAPELHGLSLRLKGGFRRAPGPAPYSVAVEFVERQSRTVRLVREAVGAGEHGSDLASKAVAAVEVAQMLLRAQHLSTVERLVAEKRVERLEPFVVAVDEQAAALRTAVIVNEAARCDDREAASRIFHPFIVGLAEVEFCPGQRTYADRPAQG